MLRLFGDVYWACRLTAFFESLYLTKSLDNFEMASLPTTTAEERSRLLSFVVCGGGPTVRNGI